MTTRFRFLLLAFIVSGALWAAIITGVIWYFDDGTSGAFTAATH